jgi:hypothetical protein
MAVGHSGTPLAGKLGIKEGALVATVDVPEELLDFFDDVPDGVEFREGIDRGAAFVLLFATEPASLEKASTGRRRGHLSRRSDLGGLAQEGLEGPDGHDRGHRP